MKLTDHFDDTEFERNGPYPDDCGPVVLGMCKDVLEPIRAQFGPIIVTSGYRPPEINTAVHGVVQSQHVYTPDHCAADWYIQPPPDAAPPGQTPKPPFDLLARNRLVRKAFDWIRLRSGLPIDQLILEHDPAGDVIHTSYVLANPRYEAMEGLTGNRSGYVRWNYPTSSVQS